MDSSPPSLSLPLLSRRIAGVVAAALLALMTLFLIASVRQQSQTFDESTHLLAGFEYWKRGDFGRNPEHPPLLKLLATIPVLPMGLREPPPVPIPFFKAQDSVNAEQLLYSADADSILLRGRLVVALFSLALALLVFVAAQEMFGALTGLVALGLFVFEPVVLAHGALVTTDIPLAAAFFATVYAFYRYSCRPSRSRAVLCALCAAVTVLTKHSGLLILPTLVLLALADWLFVEHRRAAESTLDDKVDDQPARRRARDLVVLLVLITIGSYAVLWAIYGLRYAARPGQLQLVPSLAAYSTGMTHPIEGSIIGFCARHHLLPEAYLYGWVDILRISGQRRTFVFGRLFPNGQWFFYPGVILIKSTLTLLVLLLLAPFARIRRRRRELLFLTVPAGFFLLVAIFSMINLGIRHLLPIYPFLIVLAAAAATRFATRSRAARFAVVAALALTVISSLHAFPDYLAYSNEIAGGPAHTYRLVADSNADWGQTLKWTRAYLDQHPTNECWMSYSNPMVPVDYYGIRCKLLLTSFGHLIGSPTAPIPPTISGTILVSSFDTSGLMWGPDSLNPYATFRDRKPDAAIGNVMLVYHGTFDVPLLAAENNATLATVMLREHRLPQAVGLAQLAAQEAPNSADVNAVLGQTLLASGKIEEGKRAMRNALHLAQTDHPDFQDQLIAQIEHPPAHP